jgi:hypothetical protein
MTRSLHIEIKQYSGLPRFILFAWIMAHFFILVSILNAEPSNKETFRKAVTRDITYGRDKSDVGSMINKDHFREGPESFTNDEDGNVYICDTVNRSIKIFSSHGANLGEIALGQTMSASDMVVSSGYLYLYDDPHGKLYQIDRSGNVLNTISVDSSRFRSRGPMHLVNNDIFMITSGQEDILIGRIEANILVAPQEEKSSAPLQKGIQGPSGKRYFIKIQRLKSGEIEVLNKAGELIKSIPVSLPGVVSMSFLREDSEGNFYLQSERIDNKNIVLEVHKFDADGTHLSEVSIPENDYSSWSVKLLSVDDHGNINQFVPKKDRGQLNIYHKDAGATRGEK